MGGAQLIAFDKNWYIEIIDDIDLILSYMTFVATMALMLVQGLDG